LSKGVGAASLYAFLTIRSYENISGRRVALPAKIDNWSLTSLQLVKVGGRLVKHAATLFVRSL
jgi:hypothetical protein